jgi:hypothetical protein
MQNKGGAEQVSEGRALHSRRGPHSRELLALTRAISANLAMIVAHRVGEPRG